MGSSGKLKEISLGNAFGDVSVSVNGVRVEVRTDGSILAYTNKSVDAYTNGPVAIHPAVNDGGQPGAVVTSAQACISESDYPRDSLLLVESSAVPPIVTVVGDKMPDGTILAGYLEGRPLYATAKDAPGTYSFNEAAEYATNLDVHGHHDFHAPSKGELNVLWENRNKGTLAGTFNETGRHPDGWYWSSSPYYYDFGWAQRFSDGRQCNGNTLHNASLRCVR